MIARARQLDAVAIPRTVSRSASPSREKPAAASLSMHSESSRKMERLGGNTLRSVRSATPGTGTALAMTCPKPNRRRMLPRYAGQKS